MPNRDDKSPSVFRHLDWPTIIIYLLMVTLGIVSIYAASYDFDNASMLSFDEFSGKQVRWIGLALVLGFVILLMEYRFFETYAYPVYLVMMLLLFVTPFFAPNIKGSHSWLVIGPMSLQPAEFAKVATALALAKLFNGYNFRLNAKLSNIMRAVMLILLPVLLILLQSETGSALAYLALFLVLYREGMTGLVLFSAVFAVVIFVLTIKLADPFMLGICEGEMYIYMMVMVIMTGMSHVYSRRTDIARNVLAWFSIVMLFVWIVGGIYEVKLPGHALLIGAVVVACVYLAFEAFKNRLNRLYIPIVTSILSLTFMFSVDVAFESIQDHQKGRIEIVLGVRDDLKGDGYNVNQSKIAIGSGGFAGKGFLNGTQTKLKYVPEQHTDFIFCTIGEEEGFLGSLLTISLYLALILRIIYLAERQPRPFGRVYAYCVASYFIFHFCINIGMVIGLCPVIGIPLPFISYGGSSLWGFTILLFILLRIDAARKSFH